MPGVLLEKEGVLNPNLAESPVDKLFHCLPAYFAQQAVGY